MILVINTIALINIETNIETLCVAYFGRKKAAELAAFRHTVLS